MSKIICDVCGTAFAENAAQCPICGSAKRANPMTAGGNNDAAEQSGYKTVKGGRFSKRNVRKRNQEAARQNPPENSGENQDEEKGNKGLMILMFVLIGAVIAVILYILLRLVGPVFNQPTVPTEPTVPPTVATDPTNTPTDPTNAPTDPTDPTDETVPCDGLILHIPQIELKANGETATIDVTASPADKTDPILFTSSDENVAIVDENGVVTAVGNGSATITVSCGQFHVDCQVVVDMPTEPPTEPPTVPPTEPPTEPEEQITMNRDDISFFGEGEYWDLYSGKLPLNKLTWYSDNESIATIEDGVVTAVSPGVTTVYGEYNGITVSCVIRCRWEEVATEPTQPPLDPNENYTMYVNGGVPVWGYDVSVGIGESFRLTLCDSDGNVMDVDWMASQSGYVEIDGNWVTGVDYINSSGFTVYVTVGDHTYSCVVRVK